MECAEALRTQAYFDGELDALAAAQVEQHLERCAACREQLQALERAHDFLESELPYETAPAALRERIRLSLDRESAPTGSRARDRRPRAWSPRWFWLGSLAGGSAMAALAVITFVLMSLPAQTALLDEVLAAHLQSLQPQHLTDVISTDQHTVRPWFAGRTDVSPVVADFASQGYRLLGGRADYLDHQRAAVLVYQHGPHVINVFGWAGSKPIVQHRASRNGYRLMLWRAGGIEYCAISDTGWDELAALAQLMQDQSAKDAAEVNAGGAGE